MRKKTNTTSKKQQFVRKDKRSTVNISEQMSRGKDKNRALHLRY